MGVLAVLHLAVAPAGEIATALLWIGVAILALRRRSAGWIAIGCAMLGGALTAADAGQYLEKRWPSALDGERVLAEVIVETIPVGHGDAWSFDASALGARLVRAPLNVRVISRDMSVRPRAGERWQLVLAMRAPRARVNPGAVDLEQQSFRARVHAMATVVPSRLNRRIDSGHRPLTRVREAAARRIEQRIDDRDAAALIQALAVGATGSMSAEQWRVFNATGTSHLVAISGLHVTLFATVAFFASRRLWSGLLWRFTVWPRDSLAALIALGAAFGYALLAGLSVPTQRTLIMLAAWLLARSLSRASPAFAPFWLALIAVLLLDPFAPLGAGFWLSFAAMGAIIVATEPRIVRRRLLHGMATVQGAVTAMLAPFSVAWFGSLSIIGVLVNVVAIPAVSWVFVPTILVAVIAMPLWPAASDAVLDFAARLHEYGWSWLVAASDLPSAGLRIHPPDWWYPLAMLGIGASLLPLPSRLRLAAILWLVPLAFAGDAAIPHGGMELTVLDVGRGTAIVVRTAHRALVYGTGEVYATEGRVVENILLPFLRQAGVDRIDVLVVPQLNGPASLGVTALLAELPVAQTFSNCTNAARWHWDGVQFTLDSCVLSISSPAGRVVVGNGTELASWAVVGGRRVIAGHERAALRRTHAGDVGVLTTEAGGAIRVLFDPVSGPGEPQPMRRSEPKVWRLPP